MRINEVITESLGSGYKLEWDDQFGPKEIHARAYDRQGQYIDINFVPVRDNVTDVEFSKMDNYEQTGQGDEFAVFATVLEAIKRYLQGYQPKILVFSGKGESRGSLYQKLITRFAGQVGYKQFDTSKLSPEAQRQMGGTNVFILRKMNPVQEADEQITLAPDPGRSAAKAWIEKVYAKYPQQWQNNHVMPMGGEGEDQQFALFELTPSLSKRGAVEVKWFQAYPLRQGVGSRAMQQLQSMAREDGIALTLFPWAHGQVSQPKLTKFYKGQGFKPTAKGAKTMAWEPQLNELRGIKKDFGPDDSTKQVLTRYGFKQIGFGTFASVWAHPDLDYVLKTFSQRDKAYLNWVTVCSAHKNNPYLPKFISVKPLQLATGVYAVRMERLAPAPFNYERIADNISKLVSDCIYDRPDIKTIEDMVQHIQTKHGSSLEYLKSYVNDVQLLQAILLIVEFIRSGQGHPDINVRNIMLRGNTIVFTDPVI